MIDIPHLPPIRFAQEVTKQIDAQTVVVRCVFQAPPSMAQMIEAAAQASAGFGIQEGQDGYLVQVKDVNVIEKPTQTTLFVKVSNTATLGNTSQFTFTFFNDLTLCDPQLCSGNFTIFKQ
jgi:hypothetical protein